VEGGGDASVACGEHHSLKNLDKGIPNSQQDHPRGGGGIKKERR